MKDDWAERTYPPHGHPDLERSIGRLEGKVESLEKEMVGGFKRVEKSIKTLTGIDRNQNGRIARLGGKQQWILGGVMAIGFLTWLGFQLYFSFVK